MYIYIYAYIYIIYTYIYIYIYRDIRRPLQSVERVRLQPSKSTMPFNIQAQAARQQPKQPRMTHACSSPGWMVQNLINYSSIGATAGPSRTPQGISRCGPSSPPLPPWALNLMLPPAQECQIAHWNTLSNPVELTCHPKPSKQ